MYGKDYATLEALTDKADPSRLRIDIQLQSPRRGTGLPDYEFADFQRAIREGFREALAGAELQRLIQASNQPKPARRGWFGRVVAFVVSAAIGSVATLLLSASSPHTTPRYAAGSLTPPLAAGAPASSFAPSAETEAPSPGSQSTGAPTPAPPEPARSATGPATFGLHEQ